MSNIAGLPFWELHFDADGKLLKHVGAIPSQLTDLFICAHSWNNDYNDAKDLYDFVFEKLAETLMAAGAKRDIQMGLAGVFWPSMLWPGDEPQLETTGMPSFGPVERSWASELKKAYGAGKEQAIIDRLCELTDGTQPDAQAMAEFQKLLGQTPDSKTEVGIAAIRQAAYFNLVERAGRVGEHGLGALFETLPKTLQVHLIGEGFGARLVASAGGRHVGSIVLLQGVLTDKGLKSAARLAIRNGLQPIVPASNDITSEEVAQAALKAAGIV